MEGAIVNIIDQRVLRLTPQHFSYTLAKSALWTATQTLAQALAPRIRVNAVGPGPTYPSVREGEAGLAREAAGAPLGRAVSGEEIADAVVLSRRGAQVSRDRSSASTRASIWRGGRPTSWSEHVSPPSAAGA